MTFHSILFERTEQGPQMIEAPEFFVDLNLDQIVETVAAGREEYNLKPFFYAPLEDEDAVAYRHEVLRDLEGAGTLEPISAFAQKMHAMREHLAQADKLHYPHQKESWFLDAAEIYTGAVTRLAAELSTAKPASRGLLAFREYVASYAASERFTALTAEVKKLKSELSTVKYCILIQGNSFKVRKYEGETDYSAEVEKTFEKFKRGAVKDYRVEYLSSPEMNHIEEKVLEFVAKLYPEIFSHLGAFCADNRDFLDKTIATFDREIQFYLAWLEHVARLGRAGLKFCYPQVSTTSKEVYSAAGFDPALAHKLSGEGGAVVCNDFYLTSSERIFIVSGPNQGGKTTFARTFGQLHYLASLGLTVPGSKARLFLSDAIFTHFEREEDITNLRGKLQDDLVRIRDILERATPESIVIMNEIFTSTTLQDAIFLSEKVMERITALDALCVWVTFIDELAAREQTVSMVSTIVPENPAQRTYKIIRRPADGLAYAMSLAEKYRLTYARLKERLP